MQGELSHKAELVAGLQVDNAKVMQKCDVSSYLRSVWRSRFKEYFQMLFEMNQSLDSDRRALMDHVSQLLSQYHSLLTHSLEDKQHYHLEEKLFTDKLNNLCRQKEKLEEKIMEHYRKLDNASTKKYSWLHKFDFCCIGFCVFLFLSRSGFGSTLVRRMRKAGSDIISKVPSRVSFTVQIFFHNQYSNRYIFIKSMPYNLRNSTSNFVHYLFPFKIHLNI